MITSLFPWNFTWLLFPLTFFARDSLILRSPGARNSLLRQNESASLTFCCSVLAFLSANHGNMCTCQSFSCLLPSRKRLQSNIRVRVQSTASICLRLFVCQHPWYLSQMSITLGGAAQRWRMHKFSFSFSVFFFSISRPPFTHIVVYFPTPHAVPLKSTGLVPAYTKKPLSVHGSHSYLSRPFYFPHPLHPSDSLSPDLIRTLRERERVPGPPVLLC